MVDLIQFRRDTSVNWIATNPTLAQGEMGLDLTANRFKIGDGIHAWNDLEYASDIAPATTVTDETSYGITPAVGTSADYARKDHTHGTPAAPTKASIGLSNVPNVDATVASNITQDSTHRFITDAEKSSYAGKQDALGFTPVPNTRAVNGKALNADITLSNTDVGAEAAGAVATHESTYNHSFIQESTYCGFPNRVDLTDNGDGTVTIAAHDVFFYDTGAYGNKRVKFSISGQVISTSSTPAIIEDAACWIVAFYNNGSPIWSVVTNRQELDYQNIIPHTEIFKRSGSNNMHFEPCFLPSTGIAERIAERLYATEEVGREYGLIISADPADPATPKYKISEGAVWLGVNRIVLAEIPLTNSYFNVRHVGGVYVASYTTGGPVIDNQNYDDGTDIQALTDGHWVVNHIYRGVESQLHTYRLLSNVFTSLDLAKASGKPTGTPAILEHTVYVGRIIVQHNETNHLNFVIESAFDTVFAASGTITDHNVLSGLQGGAPSQYYHLNQSQHTGLVGGTTTDLHNHNFALSQGSDVAITSPSNGQAIIYASGVSKWENQAITYPSTTHLQATSLMSNYELAAHTSVFQQTSLMSNYDLAANTTRYAGIGLSLTNATATLNTAGLQLSVNSTRSLSLNEIQSPAADVFFNMGTRQIQFQYLPGATFSTNTNRQGLFEIDVQGNLTDGADVMHIHQSVNDPSIDLLHLEGSGTNITGLRISVGASVAAELNRPIKFIAGSSPMVLGTSQSNLVSNLNAQYLNGSQASQFLTTQTVQTQSLVSGIQAQGANGTATLQGGVFVAAGNNVTLSTGVGGYSIHANATSQLQQTSAMSLYAQTSNSSLFQQSSLMSNYAPISNTTLFQQTSLMSNYAASNHTHAYAGLGTSATNASITLNSNGLAISVAAPGAGGGIALAADAHTFSTGTVGLVAGNNITLSSSGNSVTIIGPSPAGGGGSVYGGDFINGSTNGASTTLSVTGLQATSLMSNYALQANSSLFQQSSLMSNYDLVANSTLYQQTSVSSLHLQTSVSSLFQQTSQMSNYPGLSTGATNASITLNSQGLAISVAAPGGGAGATLSRWVPTPVNYMSTIAHSNATLMFSPIYAQQNASFSRADLFASLSFTTQTNNSTTSGTVSISNALYSWNASTWSQIASGSQSYSFSNSSNARTSLYFGIREVTIPLNASVTPGNYMYAWWIRTSGHTMTVAPMVVSHLTNAYSGDWGAATATTMQFMPGGGISSVSLTNAMPSTVGIGEIQGQAAGFFRTPILELVNKDLG